MRAYCGLQEAGICRCDLTNDMLLLMHVAVECVEIPVDRTLSPRIDKEFEALLYGVVGNFIHLTAPGSVQSKQVPRRMS